VTPNPTFEPSPSPSCGNGIVEPGEECDGQPVCDADCHIGQGLCCQVGPVCDLGISLAHCEFDFRGTVTPGICVLDGGVLPPPDSLPTGRCRDDPFRAIPLCCQITPTTCSGSMVTNWFGLDHFQCVTPPSGTSSEMVGTCGPDGICMPGEH
jgi:hypothetical protein